MKSSARRKLNLKHRFSLTIEITKLYIFSFVVFYKTQTTTCIQEIGPKVRGNKFAKVSIERHQERFLD